MLFAEGTAHAADDKELPSEHTIIIGVGGATEYELGNGSFHSGANVMVEWDAIENWLELEVATSLLAADKGIELPVDLIVKKPFRLTQSVELMLGVGPELVRISTPARKTTYAGGQIAVDFMLWPSHRFGLWVEPTYDLVFRHTLSHGIGSTGGLLVGW